MALPNIAHLSASELQSLIAAARRAMKRQRRETRAAVRELRAKAKKLGLDLVHAVTRAKPVRKRAKRKASAKYRNPKDASQQWSGVGRAPKWAASYRKSGQLSKLLIK